jgi:hypothetical protein
MQATRSGGNGEFHARGVIAHYEHGIEFTFLEQHQWLIKNAGNSVLLYLRTQLGIGIGSRHNL